MSCLTFKSLADMKRKLKVGMRFKVDNLLFPSASGDREISRAQGNALASWFTKPDGTRDETWVTYPKASEIRFEGERIVFLSADGSIAFVYHSFVDVRPLKYVVLWDDGAGKSGEFPERFDTYEEAEAYGSKWRSESNTRDFGTPDVIGEGYTYEVTEVRDGSPKRRRK